MKRLVAKVSVRETTDISCCEPYGRDGELAGAMLYSIIKVLLVCMFFYAKIVFAGPVLRTE